MPRTNKDAGKNKRTDRGQLVVGDGDGHHAKARDSREAVGHGPVLRGRAHGELVEPGIRVEGDHGVYARGAHVGGWPAVCVVRIAQAGKRIEGLRARTCCPCEKWQSKMCATQCAKATKKDRDQRTGEKAGRPSTQTKKNSRDALITKPVLQTFARSPGRATMHEQPIRVEASHGTEAAGKVCYQRAAKGAAKASTP